MAKIQEPKQKKNGSSCHEAIETTGECFSDGTVLELVRLNPASGQVGLLRWDGRKATIDQHFEVNGRVFRPPRLNSTLLSALRLPEHVAQYGSTRELFTELYKHIKYYTDIAEASVQIIAYFVLADWLLGRLSVAPLLFITAPPGTPRAQLLRLLSGLCRRPLMLAEVTASVLSSLAGLRPTLLLDEPNLRGRVLRLLYATNVRGRFVPIKERVVDAFCAKVICSQEPLSDAPLAGQALQITLSPAGREVPFLEESVCERVAGEFQSKLLQYRLTNLSKICTPGVDVSELTPPMQDVARSLASCVADDEELQSGVVRLLRELDQDAYLDPSAELASVILEGLLFCCHSKKRSQVLSGELADIVNQIWAKRGEGRETTPESVGRKLRALGLRTKPIDGAGKGLRFTETIRLRIHTLARAYRVPSLRQMAQEGCAHCKRPLESS